jgi:glycosyltransferase involved in cell wall biosynthesis
MNWPRALVGRVVLLSADPWDEVWRRNQHLSTQMVRLGLARVIVYVNPPVKLGHVRSFRPEDGITVVTPHLVAPRVKGGLRLLAVEIRRLLRSADVLWINDAVLGCRCLRPGLPALYDVTDDWRTARLTPPDRANLVAAEDTLASLVSTTVCSDVLATRWHERYGIIPPVIRNGVDSAAHVRVTRHELRGAPPHLMYVGTLHDDRLDIDLLVELAGAGVGQVHLVGPDHLSSAARTTIEGLNNVAIHGAIPHTDVPGWMAAADVLVCPHRVTEFTLSLDAIKSFEYLASRRPVVATPTSGFQDFVGEDGVNVVNRSVFVDAVAAAAREAAPAGSSRSRDHDWSVRAREFAHQLSLTQDPVA